MYNSIKRYYDSGRYTKEQVKVFVQAGWIDEANYQTITNEEYAA